MNCHPNEIETQETIFFLKRELSRIKEEDNDKEEKNFYRKTHTHTRTHTLGRDGNQKIKLFGRIYGILCSAVDCWFCIVVKSLTLDQIHRHSLSLCSPTPHIDITSMWVISVVVVVVFKLRQNVSARCFMCVRLCVCIFKIGV